MAEDLKPGTVILADVAPVTQEQINTFGALLGTHGRIHTDPEWAKTTPLKGVITQGMLVLAPIHEVMCRLFGAERWLRQGEIDAKIIAYSRPNEGATVRVTIDRAVPDAAGTFSIAKNGGGEVLVGTFSVRALA